MAEFNHCEIKFSSRLKCHISGICISLRCGNMRYIILISAERVYTKLTWHSLSWGPNWNVESCFCAWSGTPIKILDLHLCKTWPTDKSTAPSTLLTIAFLVYAHPRSSRNSVLAVGISFVHWGPGGKSRCQRYQYASSWLNRRIRYCISALSQNVAFAAVYACLSLVGWLYLVERFYCFCNRYSLQTRSCFRPLGLHF